MTVAVQRQVVDEVGRFYADLGGFLHNFTTTTTGAMDVTLTFSSNFANAPSCYANDDGTGVLQAATSAAVGSVHIKGTTVSGNTIRGGCIGN